MRANRKGRSCANETITETVIDVKVKLEKPIDNLSRHSSPTGSRETSSSDRSHATSTPPSSSSSLSESLHHLSEKDETRKSPQCHLSVPPFEIQKDGVKLLSNHANSNNTIKPLKLKLRTNVGQKTEIRTSEMSEIWEDNGFGLSHGHKKAKDESWEEKWMQQKTQRREGAQGSQENIIFGRSCGIDRQLKQRWTANWKTHTESDDNENKLLSLRKVQKSVRQYDVDMDTIIEEWDEEIDEESQSGESLSHRTFQTTKKGENKNTGRKWAEIKKEKRMTTKDEEEKIVEVVEEFTEEMKDSKQRRRLKKQADGSEFGEIIKTVPKKLGQACTVKEVWCRNPEGTKWGKKTEFIDAEEELTVTWFEKLNGDQEIVESRKTKSSTSGKKSGKSHTGETYHEKWEKTENHNESSRCECSDLMDKWWTNSEGHTWGEKMLKNKIMTDNGQMIQSKTANEKWYDNGVEKVVDNWKKEEKFNENSKCIETIEHGYKNGNRYQDGTEWGDKWYRRYELITTEKMDPNASSENENETTSNSKTHSQENNNMTTDDLLLRLSQHEQWWKEPNGNRWGQKRYSDFKTKEEKNENWYNNGVEEQVDRWEVTPDGTRRGEKFGNAADGKRIWKEKWSGAGNSDFWVDKFWCEQSDSQKHEWGEASGQEGLKKWRQKWEEVKLEENDTGSRWLERWDDDGFGNFQTTKEGIKWVDGVTINQFTDRYGERLGIGEKWAVKEGKTSEGNEWVEKWNESPTAKIAEKSGKNSFGDEWQESWKEQITETAKFAFAEKSGKNAHGDEWFETWTEQGNEKKTAKKIGRNDFEEWQEEWGEELNKDGSGQKWTSKWQKRADDEATGKSWGDSWGSDGIGGHRWGETWSNDQVDKWWHDTTGKPMEE